MPILDKIRRKSNGIAGDISEYFSDELNPVPALKEVRRVSINLGEEEDVEESIDKYITTGSTDFDPVPFTIRDEDQKRLPILSARVVSGKGFVVSKFMDYDDDYFTVRLMQEETEDAGGHKVFADVLNGGKNTAFKIVQVVPGTMVAVGSDITEENEDGTKSMPQICRTRAKMLGVANALHVVSVADSHYYKIMKDGELLAKILPQTGKKNCYDVEFPKNCDGESLGRTIGMAVALWLTLDEAYKTLGNLYRESVKTN